jgi:hypothetical protein
MNKDRILRMERKLSLRATNVEAPIFLFRTEEGVTLSDYCLMSLGIPPKAFKQSKENPEERILHSGEYIDIQESYAYLRNPEKTFIILDK